MMNPTRLPLIIGLLETMFENWNRFVTETQKWLKAEKPRDHLQTQPEQKKKQGKAKGSTPPP